MTQTGKWLLRGPRDSRGQRLLCFPFAGTGASSLRRWPDRIGSAEVCLVQLPGRENRMREEPYHDFGTFAVEAAEALRPVLDQPFALFGHCMGALLAYALAVRLQETGGPQPFRLIVSSSLVPHRGFFGPFHPSMDDGRLGTDLQRISRSVAGIDPLPELLPLAIKVLRNDVQMCFGYCPQGPCELPFPVSTIGWTQDTDVRPEQMTEWNQYAPVNAHVLPGDEFTVLNPPSDLFSAIRADLAADTIRAHSPIIGRTL